MKSSRRTKRILAIDPTTKGFGWVVVEAFPLRLVDWGLRTCGNRTPARVSALRHLIERIAPTALAVQNDRLRPRRTDWILALAGRGSLSRPLHVLRLRPKATDRRSAAPRNQYQRALLTLAKFPELRSASVRARGPADREAAGMAVLDAACIALAATRQRTVDPRRRAA